MRVSSERRTRVATATCTSATAAEAPKKTMTTSPDTTTEARRSPATVPHAHWAKFCESPVSRRDWPAAVLCAATGLETLRLRSSAPGKGTLLGMKLGRTRPYDDRSQTPTSIHTSLDRADHVAVVSLFTASLRVPHSRAIALRRSDSTRRAQAACSTSKERLARGLMTGGSYWTTPVEALWNRICVPVEFTCEIRGEWGRLSCGRDSSQCG